MNINMTLIGQSIAFGVFVWFCLKYVWPPILNALEERRTKIADGLAAAEAGQRAKAQAQVRIEQEVSGAKEQAREIIANAQRRAGEIVDEAKADARVESARIIEAAQAEIDQQTHQAREVLRGEVVNLALAGAEQVLGREVDAAAHAKALESLASRL
ncbi:F0F1 ATP synthase subunit B [Thioalkalivibrio sp. HK1]|uniref:F0F1 ATP synthase subunit B n=1 Tax=Thioalkalivibrio sp. HK1 TaxID=1469245 RepID=UPI0004714E15|nr:F0F1 ATP synthase subunit B [Thioalkalivibrio sp. HK1]